MSATPAPACSDSDPASWQGACIQHHKETRLKKKKKRAPNNEQRQSILVRGAAFLSVALLPGQKKQKTKPKKLNEKQSVLKEADTRANDVLQ